jgi:integrase
MARARQKPSGKWEIGLRHPSLPGGRKYFTFDTEAEANAYADQWRLMKMADIAPPAELLKAAPKNTVTLAHVVRAWMNSGLAAPTQQSALGSLVMEVGSVRLADASYKWLMEYVQRLKVKNNLTPTSIKHRVQALGRSIDEYLRHHPDVVMQNPTRLLPKGYANYSEVDTKLAEAAGGKAKENVARDRRLHPGEHEKIIAALSGHQREDKQRGLQLKGGNALLTMYLLIVNTGLRLKEAYTLTRGQVDMDSKVIRVQNSKQWRGKVSFRDVPMRPEAHAALANYLSTRPMLPSARLFPFMDEEPDLPIKKVSQRLSFRYRLAFEYAGIVGLHEHDLRHEATCRWLELKDATGNWMFRLEEVNRIMGWSSNSTMAQRYASFRGSDLAARLWATSAAAAAGASASQ